MRNTLIVRKCGLTQPATELIVLLLIIHMYIQFLVHVFNSFEQILNPSYPRVRQKVAYLWGRHWVMTSWLKYLILFVCNLMCHYMVAW